jgi:hypothetical protein
MTVALVAVLVGYPLSFGPACWMTSIDDLAPHIAAIYWPLGRTAVNGPACIARPLKWYAGVFAPNRDTQWGCFVVPVGPEEWTLAR